MTGRRLPDQDLKDAVFAPGDYLRDRAGLWWVRPPRGHVGPLPPGPDGWTVTEHEDGTITASPSIHAEGVWHGFLVRGVWVEV